MKRDFWRLPGHMNRRVFMLRWKGEIVDFKAKHWDRRSREDLIEYATPYVYSIFK